MKLSVHFTPHALLPGAVAGKPVLIIDILRATTTMVTALAHGARAILPAPSAEEALRIAHDLERDDLLLAGERSLGRGRTHPMLASVLLTFAAIDPFATWPTSRLASAVEGESMLTNVRQLTFGGDNAEAYVDVTGKKITWQSRQPGFPDEQIFTMNIDGKDKRLASTGLGRCTCSYFSPDGKSLYFSSTHATNKGAQRPVDMSKGYVWMVNPEFKLYKQNLDGTGLTKVIGLAGYVAESTIAPNGEYMVFDSDFEGDLEIYRCGLDGKHMTRLTHEEGYDGGPFISWDSKKIVYRRAPAFKNDTELAY